MRIDLGVLKVAYAMWHTARKRKKTSYSVKTKQIIFSRIRQCNKLSAGIKQLFDGLRMHPQFLQFN